MPHNSTSQGRATREQQKAQINGQVETKGIDVDPHERPISEARADMEQPAGEFETSHGDRSIKRGANQESEHRKRRDD
jgi:hypothetical protein